MDVRKSETASAKGPRQDRAQSKLSDLENSNPYDDLLTRFSSSLGVDIKSVDDLNRYILQVEREIDVFGSIQAQQDRSKALNALSNSLLARFELRQDTKDLDRAIVAAEASLDDAHPLVRARYLNGCGTTTLRRFGETGKSRDVNITIDYCRKSLQCTVKNDPEIRVRKYALCVALQMRYDRNGSSEDLNEAISIIEPLVESNEKQDALHLTILNSFASALQKQFESTRTLDYIDRAIIEYRNAAECVLRNTSDEALILHNLGIALQLRSERTFSMEDSEEAVEKNERAYSITPPYHTERARYLDGFGTSLRIRYKIRRSIVDLNDAITKLQAAVDSTPVDNLQRAVRLYNLGLALELRFKHLARQNDLDQATDAYKNSVTLTSDSDPFQTVLLRGLADTLLLKYEATGRINYLRESIAIARNSLRRMVNVYERALCLNSLGSALGLLFKHAHLEVDLDEAITSCRGAVDGILNDLPKRAMCLNILGSVLQLRFEWSKQVEDSDGAIAAFKEAAASSSQMYEEAIAKGNLGSALKERFRKTQCLKTLLRAIEMIKASFDLLPEGSYNHAAMSDNLGLALVMLWQRKGVIKDLNEAIVAHEKAAVAVGRGHADCPKYLYNLGSSLRMRFETIWSTEDLNRAVETLREALELMLNQSSDRSRCQIALANALQTRFEYGNSVTDLKQSLIQYEDVINATTLSDESRALCLTNMSRALVNRYRATNELEDLDNSIILAERATKCSPNEEPIHWVSLNCVCNFRRIRFEERREKEDLLKSIDSGKEAVSAVPKDHPLCPKFLLNLGMALAHLYIVEKQEVILEQVVTAYSEGMYISTASPVVRLGLALAVIYVLIPACQFERANQPLKEAVRLLSRASPRSLRWPDQQRALSKMGILRLGGMAAATSLQCGDSAIEALGLLEIGRGIMARKKLDIRTDLTELWKRDPDVAERFERLQDELHNDSDLSHVCDNYANATNRHHAADEFETVLQEIHSLPGFDRFLLNLSDTEMINLGGHGPIIVFNVDFRSDAFLVTNTTIRQISLPDLNIVDLEKKAKEFGEVLSTLNTANYLTARRMLKRINEWLWDVAVGPVLHELGFTETPATHDDWPHVWWVPTGLLSMLPIHAAGYHEESSTRNVLSRVISSYVPTIKSLAYARERAAKLSVQKDQNMLLVSMSETPNQAALLNVDREIDIVQSVIPEHVTIRVLATPSKADVLAQLRTSQIVHFACHGHSDMSDPSNSRLLLQDWQTNPLTVSDLAALHNRNAQFAYLSACHTVSVKVEKLLDEGIHLAGACHLAGFPYVVGTLWEIKDEESVAVAEGVYSTMLRKPGMIDVSLSAKGLHFAVRKLREETRNIRPSSKSFDDPLIWASYIHVGA